MNYTTEQEKQARIDQVLDMWYPEDDDAEWHDDCDQWELDYAEGTDEDRATANADWFEFCEMHDLPF